MHRTPRSIGWAKGQTKRSVRRSRAAETETDGDRIKHSANDIYFVSARAARFNEIIWPSDRRQYAEQFDHRQTTVQPQRSPAVADAPFLASFRILRANTGKRFRQNRIADCVSATRMERFFARAARSPIGSL